MRRLILQVATIKSVGWCSRCVDAMSSARITNCTLPTRNDVFNATEQHWVWRGCSVHFGHGQTSRDLVRYESEKHFSSGVYAGTSQNASATSAAVWTLNDIVDPVNTANLYASSAVGVEHPLISLAYMQWAGTYASDTHGDWLTGIELSHAEECALSLCESEYHPRFVNGTLDMREMAFQFGRTSRVALQQPDLWRDYSIETTQICWQAKPGSPSVPYVGFNDTAWTYAGTYGLLDAEGGRIELHQTLTPRLYLNESLGLVCPADMYGPVIANALVGHAHSAPALPAIAADGLTREIYSSDTMARILSANLSTVLEGVAASLTKLNLETSNHTVIGNVTSVETYVHVTWEWLILPWMLDLLGLIVLLAAMYQSSVQKVDVWRSSILPLLFHGLEQPVGTMGEASGKLSGMQSAAEYRYVKMAVSADDGRVVLASQGHNSGSRDGG